MIYMIFPCRYALKPYLLTPLANANQPEEIRYNDAHVRTRGVIERTFGLMKMRFRCMDGSGGVILSHPDVACDMILAVASLHNIAERRRIPILHDDYMAPNHPMEQPELVLPIQDLMAQGAEMRRNVIQTFA